METSGIIDKKEFISLCLENTYLNLLSHDTLNQILGYLELYSCDRPNCNNDFLDKPNLEIEKWCFVECSKYNEWDEINCGDCRKLEYSLGDDHLPWKVK